MKTSELAINALQPPKEDLRGHAATKRLRAGAFIAHRELETICGEVISVPDPDRYVHLQFRRFAGCPVCNLHLHSFVQRHDEIVRAGIREIVLFHSTRQDLQTHASELPFAIVADPDKVLYREFGVEASVRSLLHPRAWWPIARSILRSLRQVLFLGKPVPSLNPPGGRYGLPADFLVASDGTLVASKYGAHVYDQWSVDDLLGVVPRSSPPA